MRSAREAPLQACEQPAPTRVRNEANVVAEWGEAHRYSPAPRHRRRLILKLVRDLDVGDVLDAGCGQPYLLAALKRKLGVDTYGCDVSDAVMNDPEARALATELRVVDLSREAWPADRQFDLVISTEVLEHIEDWRTALGNLAAMSRRYVLITVPGGVRRAMDEIVGHHRHFSPADISGALRDLGFEPMLERRWGFPVHTLYRWAISRFGADRMYGSFAAAQEYGPGKKLVSALLYASFFINDLFSSGDQVMVLARRSR